MHCESKCWSHHCDTDWAKDNKGHRSDKVCLHLTEKVTKNWNYYFSFSCFIAEILYRVLKFFMLYPSISALHEQSPGEDSKLWERERATWCQSISYSSSALIEDFPILLISSPIFFSDFSVYFSQPKNWEKVLWCSCLSYPAGHVVLPMLYNLQHLTFWLCRHFLSVINLLKLALKTDWVSL